ncbi:hypothetical protein [Streptomyces sp. NPDC059819]|uniref:hypothetical protein n=1 Tax=Streptomyces sp. NPDC059819 TaxID=3346963 RepID=UPI00365D20B3
MARSVYVGPEWPDGEPEPEAESHFYCANVECPSAFGTGHGPVPNTRKYRIPGGFICELCAEAHDSKVADEDTTATPLQFKALHEGGKGIMRCSTVQSTIVPGDEPCQGTATHLLIGSTRTDESSREPFRDPVCKPCGKSYARRPALKARLVPFHVHVTDGMIIETVEGHRLVEDSEHEAKCVDCGTTGTPNSFRFATNGCPGRPESITVLHRPRETYGAPLAEWAAESARLWWTYAVDYLGMHIEDWRVVTGDAQYSAYFTFRDREYGLRHSMPDGRYGAEALPNRGWPQPSIINPELGSDHQQAVLHFYNRITDSGSQFFATWTPSYTDVADRELIILYTPEGQISEVLRTPACGGGT